MISIVAFIIGALWGARVAQKRGGSKADILKYGAVHGIIFALIAIIFSVIALRLGWI